MPKPIRGKWAKADQVGEVVVVVVKERRGFLRAIAAGIATLVVERFIDRLWPQRPAGRVAGALSPFAGRLVATSTATATLT